MPAQSGHFLCNLVSYMHPDFISIVNEAWHDYDASREVINVQDISAKVSTNHVFQLLIDDNSRVIAKVSYFGTFDGFMEDHSLINALANNLPDPYDQFLSRSLIKKNQLYTYTYNDGLLKAWVVFYNPIGVDRMLPKVLNKKQIISLGSELAKFHKTCTRLINVLPDWSKTIKSDTDHLLGILSTDLGKFHHRGTIDEIRRQVDLLHENCQKLSVDSWSSIPVFVDWNIGNFSVTKENKFFSRWDYDWFRMSSRIMDFYFFSRVCSRAGDKTMFSYTINPVMEERFLLFLEAYHKEAPLSKDEILFMKEAYRFFILNYVIKDGRYFFHEIYATKLQQEAFDTYFPQLDQAFNPEKILKKLDL